MLRPFAVLLAVFVANATPSFAHITFAQNCEKETLMLIDGATGSIDVAVYSISNVNIVDALMRARDRGVKIRIITDRSQAFSRYSRVRRLHDSGLDIKVHSKHKIMHHKFAIFDKNKAVEGSFNWTHSAARKNDEDCNIFNNKKDLKALEQRFESLWVMNDKGVSECYFDNMMLRKSRRVRCVKGAGKK